MAILYIEAFSGMSGDMFLGSLADHTVAYDELRSFPKLFGLEDAVIEISQVNRNGIVCKHVNVIDMNEDKDHKKHTHRKPKDIFSIIDRADVTENARRIAKEIFTIIGLSESKIHQVAIEDIHFYEISGVDSIVDILGSAVLIDRLQIDKVYADPICTGYGFVKTQHGTLPVPAPATADILQGFSVYKGEEKGEKVTPTGAAILKYLNPDFNVPVLVKKKIAHGPGKKDFKTPNVFRLSLCEDEIKSLETYGNRRRSG